MRNTAEHKNNRAGDKSRCPCLAVRDLDYHVEVGLRKDPEETSSVDDQTTMGQAHGNLAPTLKRYKKILICPVPGRSEDRQQETACGSLLQQILGQLLESGRHTRTSLGLLTSILFCLLDRWHPVPPESGNQRAMIPMDELTMSLVV